MFANLDRLRSERDKLQLRLIELQDKVAAAEEKVKEAEAAQVLDMVGVIKMTPEELAELIHKEKGIEITDFAKGAVVKKTDPKTKIVGSVTAKDNKTTDNKSSYEEIMGGNDTDEI